MIEWVIAQPIRPAVSEIAALGGMDAKTPERGLSPARRFKMDGPREGCPDGLVAKLLEPQAQVDVIELDRQVNGVEAANGPELRPFDGEAGSGHGGNFMRDRVPFKPARGAHI